MRAASIKAGAPGGSVDQRLEGLGVAVGVGALGLGQRLEPVGDLVEAFFAGLLGHARVHVGVLVGLAGHGGLQVEAAVADGQAGGRIARSVLQEFEVAMRVAGFAFGGGAEQRRDVVLAFYVGLVREVQV